MTEMDDNETDDLMKIENEVFGKENFMACFPRVTKRLAGQQMR